MTATICYFPAERYQLRALPTLDDRISAAFHQVHTYAIGLGLTSGRAMLPARRTAIMIDSGWTVARAITEGKRYARELWDDTTPPEAA